MDNTSSTKVSLKDKKLGGMQYSVESDEDIEAEEKRIKATKR
jgi:hypothetical protein